MSPSDVNTTGSIPSVVCNDGAGTGDNGGGGSGGDGSGDPVGREDSPCTVSRENEVTMSARGRISM